MTRKIQLLIIVLAAFIAYSNIFGNEFLGDDKLHFTTWDEVKHFENVPSFFAGEEFRDARIRYRPVGSTFIALNYFVWRENQWGYHVTALLLHIINVVLVYFIVDALLARGPVGRLPRPTSSVSASWRIPAGARRGSPAPVTPRSLLPFAAALLFALHPANNETVNIVFSSISFGFTNFFASYYFYLRSKRLLSLFFALLAIFSYELTLSLPLVILFSHVILTQRSGERIPFKQRFADAFRMTIPYFLIALFYLGVRFFLLDIGGGSKYIEGSFLTTQFLMSIVFVKYLWLLIFPKELSINHTVLPGVQVWLDPFTNRGSLAALSFFEQRVFFSVAILAILAILAIWFYRRYPMITFSIGWFFATLLPVSYLIPQDTIMQERYLYIPSLGFFLLLSYGGFMIYDLRFTNVHKSYFLHLKSLVLLFFTLLAIGYGYRTYLRNIDYKDEVTMWSSIVRQIPNHVMSNYQLASMYAARGNADKAIEYFGKVISLEPRIPNVYYELGRIYQRIGKKQEAAKYYEQAIALYPDLILGKVALEEVTGKTEGIGWTQAEVAHALIIAYPKAWEFTTIPGGGVFVDEKDPFRVEITVDKKRSHIPAEEYVKRDTQNHGRLVQEGLAQVPNTQAAFAKVFEDNGVSKLNLYLFKEGIIIKLLVFPSNSKQMSTLNEMIRSIMVRADVSQ